MCVHLMTIGNVFSCPKHGAYKGETGCIPCQQELTEALSIMGLKTHIKRLAELTEGEARAIVEVLSCRLGFGHAADLQ